MKLSLKNSPARLASWDRYRKANLEKRREATRTYRLNNPDKVKESNRLSNNSRKRNLVHKIGHTLRNRTRLAIKNNQKVGSAVKDLGCTVEEFKLYVENLFLPNMTWDNWSRHRWHLDHIIPLSSFNLSDRKEYLKACHYTNIQPLWAKDNLIKGATK